MLSLFVGVIDVPVSSLLAFQPDAWEIFILSRLPRLLAILCAGSGLSIAGLLKQQLTANKFVAPSTGATITSSQLGILIALLFLPSSTLVSRAIFAFAMLGTFLFIWFIHNIKLKETVLVPLIGIMFSNIIGGITSFLAFRFEMTQALSTWLVGHFSLVIKGRYEIVFLVVPLICIALLYANHFNIVGMGKDFSKNLGVNYTWILILGLMIAAMLTVSIVVVGSISYIGLIVPNMITILKGDKLQNTLLDTALLGSLFTLICDVIARIVIAPCKLPMDLVIGIFGSITFAIMLLYRFKGNSTIRIFKRKEGHCA